MFETRLTDQAHLKLLEPQDSLAVFSVLSANLCELQARYAWTQAGVSAESATAFVHQTLNQYAQGLGYHAGLWVDQTLCGVLGYAEPIDFENRSARLGYWITPSVYGSGLVTQAFRQIIPHGFESYGLNRFSFRALAHQPRSHTVPQKLGFTEEGLLKQAYQLAGQRFDLKLYGLTHAQWQAQPGQVTDV